MVGVIGSTSYIQDVTHYINYVAAILFDFFSSQELLLYCCSLEHIFFFISCFHNECLNV